MLAFSFHEELSNLGRMTMMCVKIEVSLGVKGPVGELESIGTRDERICSGLETTKG